LQHFLIECDQDALFLELVQAADAEDFLGSVDDLIETVYWNSLLALEDLQRLVEQRSESFSLALEGTLSIQQVKDKLRCALLYPTANHASLLLPYEDNKEKHLIPKAIAMLGKLLPLERLYLKSFSIPKAKLLNSLYTTRVPEDEEVLALVDLSGSICFSLESFFSLRYASHLEFSILSFRLRVSQKLHSFHYKGCPFPLQKETKRV